MPGPNDNPPQWIYWFDAEGCPHACFPGTIDAGNLPAGTPQTASLGLNGQSTGTITASLPNFMQSGTFRLEVYNLGLGVTVSQAIAWGLYGDSSAVVYFASFQNPETIDPSLNAVTSWSGTFWSQVPIQQLNIDLTLSGASGVDGIAQLLVVGQ